jgi:WD40 repeat protein
MSARSQERKDSKAELIRTTRISEAELKVMFHAMDVDSSGFIDLSELQNALRLYGIQFSVGSAQKLLLKIDRSGRGEISFDCFKEFFGCVANPDDLKLLMSAETRRFYDYKQMVDNDPMFAKTFAIPPLVGCVNQISGHTESVERIAWLSDKHIISGSTEGEVRVSNIASGSNRADMLFNVGSSLYSMSLSSDLTKLLVGHGSKSDNLTLWSLEDVDAKKDGTLMIYQGPDAAVFATAWCKESLAAGGKDGCLRIYDHSTAAPVKAWDGHQGIVYSAAFPTNARGWPGILCTASKDGTVKVWDTRAANAFHRPSQVIDEVAAGGAAWQALWRKETEIVTCGEDYCIKRWDFRKLSDGPLCSYFGHSDIVRSIEQSPCEQFLVSGAFGGSVRVWLSDQAQLVHERLEEAWLEGTRAKRLAADLSKQFAAGTLANPQDLKDAKTSGEQWDVTAKLFEEEERKIKLLGCSQAVIGLEGPRLPVATIAWRDSANGVSRVAVGSNDQSIRVYEVDKQQLINSVEGIGKQP